MSDFLFTLSGWLFAMFATVLWLILCLHINATWHRQLNEMLKGFNILFETIRKDYADFCIKQNADWFTLARKITENQSDNVDQRDITKPPDCVDDDITNVVHFYCPECDTEIAKFDDYCYVCGQAIDWSEYEDAEQ